MAVKKRTKSIQDLRAQMERIENGLRNRLTNGSISRDNASNRYNQAVGAYHNLTRNIRKTKEGEAVRAQNRADHDTLLRLTGKRNAKKAQEILKRNTEMNVAFENKQMSYSARMGITG